VLLFFSAAGEPTGRFVEELHLPLEKRPSRNDDLTIALLVVRVRPYCSSTKLRSQKPGPQILDFQISDNFRSQI